MEETIKLCRLATFMVAAQISRKKNDQNKNVWVGQAKHSTSEMLLVWYDALADDGTKPLRNHNAAHPRLLEFQGNGNVALLNAICWELSVQCAAILSDNTSSCLFFYPAHVKVLWMWCYNLSFLAVTWDIWPLLLRFISFRGENRTISGLG